MIARARSLIQAKRFGLDARRKLLHSRSDRRIDRRAAIHDQNLVAHFDGVARNRHEAFDQAHVVPRREERHDVAALGLAEPRNDNIGQRQLEIEREPVDQNDVAFEQSRTHGPRRDWIPIRHRRAEQAEEQDENQEAAIVAGKARRRGETLVHFGTSSVQ